MSFWGNGRNKPWWRQAQTILFAVGCTLVALYAWRELGNYRAAIAAVLLACCSTAIGALFGFLFGIPRALTSSEPVAAASTNLRTGVRRYAGNTNLEQISDWLTKGIVAIGLVQARPIVEELDKGAKRIAVFIQCNQGFCAGVGSAAVWVIGTLFVIYGFLVGFLWTRLYLTDQFRKADDATLETPEYYEGLMHAYLYREPRGYEETLRVADEYETIFGDNFTSRMYLYLACAYAQKYQRLYAIKPKDPETETAKKATLELVTKAMDLSRENRGLIYSLWKPDADADPNGDFVIFRGSREFAERMEKYFDKDGRPIEPKPPVDAG